MSGVVQKLALESFQLKLIVIFPTQLSVLSQNKTIFGMLNHSYMRREQNKNFSDLFKILWNFLE